MTTLTVEIPDGTDRSSSVLRVEMWPRALTSGCGSFIILLDNEGGTFNGTFSAQNTVDLKVNSTDFMKGYVDTVTHIVDEEKDVFHDVLRISGRDYSQDLMDLIHTESYAYNTRIDDLIDDALDDTTSEITYASGSSESQIEGGYEAKDDYLINIFRDVMERESYDAYVNTSKAFQLIDLGSLPASGITLKSVADAADNNVLTHSPIQYTETSGLELRNYIKIIGDRVRDGWTDGNAGDYTEGTNTTVSDDTGTYKEGTGSIKGVLTYDGASAPEFYLDFSGGLYSKTLNYLEWSIYAQEQMMWWGRAAKVGVGTCRIRLRLKDTTGNVIEWKDGTSDPQTADIWYWLGAQLGTDCSIAGVETGDSWYWITSVDGNFTWNIEELHFRGCPGTVVDNYQTTLWIDDVRLPENMVSISENAASEASYRKRCIPIRKPYFKTQLELDDYSAAALAIMKDPIETLKLTADGAAGISGGACKWLPANSVTVNIPAVGISSETWRLVNIHHIVEPRKDLDGRGHDFITELELVPSSTKLIGYVFDAITSGSMSPVVGRLSQRVRNMEKQGSLSHLDHGATKW